MNFARSAKTTIKLYAPYARHSPRTEGFGIADEGQSAQNISTAEMNEISCVWRWCVLCLRVFVTFFELREASLVMCRGGAMTSVKFYTAHTHTDNWGEPISLLAS